MSNTCENSPTTPTPVPSASPAVSSGSKVASSDPNTRNSTIAAAMKPNASPVPSLLELPPLAT